MPNHYLLEFDLNTPPPLGGLDDDDAKLREIRRAVPQGWTLEGLYEDVERHVALALVEAPDDSLPALNRLTSQLSPRSTRILRRTAVDR